MTSTSTWSEGLEGPAREIAGTIHSPLRVDAGPGTGKTFALMRRVCRLLEEGCDPKRIYVGTFTRTSARDLKTSLAALSVPGADEVQAGTLHSLCFSMLSFGDVLEQTERTPRPLLKFEERFLLEDLSGGAFGGVRECSRQLKAFTAAWSRLQSEEPGWPHDPNDQQFQKLLLSWFRFHRSIHIGELIWLALQYLKQNPAARFRTQFAHVLVDEYQDLNRAEQELLDILAEAGSFTIIGDEDQSIYSFRYAHPQGIHDFLTSHPGSYDTSLLECRRCPPNIIQMANSLISHNEFRSARSLQPWCGNTLDGEVRIVQWLTMEEEPSGLASILKQRIDSGLVMAGKILVLSPKRQFGYLIRDALRGVGVPVHSFFLEEELDGDPKNHESCRVQETFSLLTLLANRDDIVALRCWCGFGSSTMSKGRWGRLRDYCEEHGLMPFNALQQLSDGSLILPHTSQLVSRFRELQKLLVSLDTLHGQALIDALLPANEEWADSLRTIAQNLAGGECNAIGLYEMLLASVSQPELPTDVDYVRVMSLHKSKGLTADLVIVAGCVKGCLPRIPDKVAQREEQRSLEEQRRLFYVAITRARKTVILSSVLKIPRNDAYRMGLTVRGRNAHHAQTIASRFLSELGSGCPKPVLGKSILS